MSFAVSYNGTNEVYNLLIPVATTAPSVYWDSSLNTNNPNNQIIKVTRPADPNSPFATEWGIIYESGGRKVTYNYFLMEQDVVNMPVSDNSTHRITIVWAMWNGGASRYSYGTASPQTPPITVGDRTPPKVTSHTPADNVTNVPLNTPIVINWTDLQMKNEK